MDFDQGGDVSALTEQPAYVRMSERSEAVLARHGATFNRRCEQAGEASGAEQVTSVEVALAARFVYLLCELPVVESRTEATCNGLGMICAIVVAEAVVGETQDLRKHPAFAVVLGKECFDAHFAILGSINVRLKVPKRNETQHSVANLGRQVSIYAPKTPSIQRTRAG